METLTKTIQELYANEDFREENQFWMTKDNMPDDVKSRLEEIITRSDSSECGSIDRIEDIALMIMPYEKSWYAYLSFDVFGKQYTITTTSCATYTHPAEHDVDTDSYKEWIEVEYKIPERMDISRVTLTELLNEIEDSELVRDAMREFTSDIDGDEEDY